MAIVAEQALVPGRVIMGRFRLERLLGRGGMGTVWQARHLALESLIAIKFLNSEMSVRHDIRARFSREATSAARIRSPHVVTILDSGFTDDGLAFIAMELLRGEDLGRRLARVKSLGLAETASLLSQVARGLSKAHAEGIVHRDLKPENLFLVHDEAGVAIKILDFGIAKAFGSEAATHKTDTGQLLGTPRYMSPEQALGRVVDQRSDLYSLAVVAYRCLAGSLPFNHAAVGEQIVAVSTLEPPPPSRFNPELPPAVDDWFARELAKDPGSRASQQALELSASFERVIATLEIGRPSSDRAHGSGRWGPSIAPVAKDVTETSPFSEDEVATTVLASPPASGGTQPLPVRPARARRSLATPWLLLLPTLAAAGWLGAREITAPGTAAAPPKPASSSEPAAVAASPESFDDEAQVGEASTPVVAPAPSPPLAPTASSSKRHVSVPTHPSFTPKPPAPLSPGAVTPASTVTDPGPVPSTSASSSNNMPQIDRDSPWP